jgi:F-type H+-transporting ATPase subunit b
MLTPGRSRRIAAALAAAALPAAAHAETMPQLNFANPLTFGQAVWLLVIFFVLYIFVKDWGLPQVAVVLEARSATIKSDLDAAHAAMRSADAAAADVAEQTGLARAEAQSRIAAAVEAAKQKAAAEAAAINARLDAQLAESEAQIGRARTAAMSALRSVATDTTQLIIDRLVGAHAAPDAVARAVAQVMPADAAA